MAVIDAHAHVGAHLTDLNRADPHELSVDYGMWTEIMDENGIDESVIMPTFSYDKRDGIESTRALNNSIKNIAETYDRFSCGIGTVEPTHGDQAIDELERLATQGFRGVSWHHRWQGSAVNDPTTIECIRKLDSLNLVGFIHCYQIAESEAYQRLEDVLEYTDQPLILLDGLTSAMSVKHSIQLGQEYENLYFDTAMMYKLGLQIERLVDELGAHRLLFGSDLYTEPLMYRNSADLYQIMNADITEDDRNAILGDNIQDLLSL